MEKLENKKNELIRELDILKDSIKKKLDVEKNIRVKRDIDMSKLKEELGETISELENIIKTSSQ